MQHSDNELQTLINHKKALREIRVQRLHHLEIQAAKQGLSAPPEVKEEISSLISEIQNDEQEIQKCENDLILKRSTSPGTKTIEHAATNFVLDPWIERAVRSSDLLDQVIAEKAFSKDNSLFYQLHHFIDSIISNNMIIEVSSERYRINERVTSLRHFWIIVITASTVQQSSGMTKWLIKETINYLRERKTNPNSIIPEAWENIFRRYCMHNSSDFNGAIFDNILQSAIDRIDRKHEELYLFFSYVYEHLGTDILSVRKVADFLEKFEERIVTEVSPAFLERLKRLIGIGKKLGIYGAGEVPSFRPKLTKITGSINCDYEFESMIFPITNHDHFSITGRLPKDGAVNPADPYVFIIDTDSFRSPFNLMYSELKSIIELCRQFEYPLHNRWSGG